MVLEKFNRDSFEEELAMMATIYRWDVKKEQDEDLGDEGDKPTPEDLEKGEIIEAIGRSLMNSGSIDLGNKRAVDVDDLNYQPH